MAAQTVDSMQLQSKGKAADAQTVHCTRLQSKEKAADAQTVHCTRLQSQTGAFLRLSHVETCLDICTREGTKEKKN